MLRLPIRPEVICSGKCVGIVGSEQAKFTQVTEEATRKVIRLFLGASKKVVSGKCHLGGVDLYAKEEAEKRGVEYVGFPPACHAWEGGYKQRNLEIARAADVCVCISVDRLPAAYKGMRFDTCYPRESVASLFTILTISMCGITTPRGTYQSSYTPLLPVSAATSGEKREATSPPLPSHVLLRTTGSRSRPAVLASAPPLTPRSPVSLTLPPPRSVAKL